MKIRHARPMDVPELLELGREIHEESRLSGLSYDAQKLRQSLEGMFAHQKGTHCLLLAISGNGDIAGVMLGYITEYFFSRDRVATNIVFYVRPEYRGSSAAAKLVMAFRTWAANRDAAEVSVNITSGIRMEKFHSFLMKMGFEHIGGNYSLWMK